MKEFWDNPNKAKQNNNNSTDLKKEKNKYLRKSHVMVMHKRVIRSQTNEVCFQVASSLLWASERASEREENSILNTLLKDVAF